MVFELLAGAALLVIVLALLTMAVIVYRDARRTDALYPPVLWAALTLVSGVGGVVLYVVVEKLRLLGDPENGHGVR